MKMAKQFGFKMANKPMRRIAPAEMKNVRRLFFVKKIEQASMMIKDKMESRAEIRIINTQKIKALT